MKTLIALDNSNCPRCHNGLLDALRQMEGVRDVRSDFSTGCLVIEHEDESEDEELGALLSLIRTADRAVAVAGNGEREMVPVGAHEAHEAHECEVASQAVRTPSGQVVPAMAGPAMAGPAMAGPGMAGPGSVAEATGPADRSLPEVWPAGVVCPVCGTGPGSHRTDGGGGVRVLTRERPTPSLLLRSSRLLIGAFRRSFGLAPVPR